MKQKFKVGDKVKAIKNYIDVTKGKIYTITKIDGTDITIIDDVSEQVFYDSILKFFIPFNPSLTITIKPSNRNGVKSFRWEFKHANGRKSNHAYNSKASAKKELTKFLDSIKNEDYEIVIK